MDLHPVRKSFHETPAQKDDIRVNSLSATKFLKEKIIGKIGAVKNRVRRSFLENLFVNSMKRTIMAYIGIILGCTTIV